LPSGEGCKRVGGLIQWLAFVPWLGWQFAVAVRLHTLTKVQMAAATA
jgi:hypothetical protein